MTISTLTTLATIAVTFTAAQGLLYLALAERMSGTRRVAFRLMALALFVFDAIALLALSV